MNPLKIGRRPRTAWARRSALVLILAAAAAHGAVGRAAEPQEGPVRVEMGEVEIEGVLDWPDVFYIIPRREVELDLGSLSRDYSGEILTPLVPGAFEHWAQEHRGAGTPGPNSP